MYRTLLLAPELFSAEGGIPRMLRIYLKALCELAGARDSVKFIALNDRVIDTQDLQKSSNERLTEWHVCNRQKLRFIRAVFSIGRRSNRLICGHVAQLPVALLAKIVNPHLRYYLVAHGIEVWRSFTAAEHLALRRAEQIFCVSEFTRQELLRRCKLSAQRAVVLPNALDPSFDIRPSRNRDGGHPVILTVTRLINVHRYKGVEHLIEAMPAIRSAHPTAVLRVIGRGDDMDRLQRLRDKLGLQSSVQFLGYVDDTRISAEMQRCSLFALPSSQEGFGLVFVEAMAHGAPCIGARAGGIPEIITPETGTLVEYGNVAAIADACTDTLRRQWDEAAILARAGDFYYSRFKERLALLLEH